jgi:threonine dehydratase
MELIDDLPLKLDYILTPVGGGGLLAGSALAAHYFSTRARVIGSEPEAVDDAFRSLASGRVESNETNITVADGLRTNLGERSFSIIQAHVDRILLVSEDEIIAAMRMIWERMKIIVEPSCAVPLAAILRHPQAFRNKEVGVILTGGNVDVDKLPF